MASRKKPDSVRSFSEFLSDPPVAMALLVFALIALFLSLLEFSQTIF